jgi:hypothetical protein
LYEVADDSGGACVELHTRSFAESPARALCPGNVASNMAHIHPEATDVTWQTPQARALW